MMQCVPIANGARPAMMTGGETGEPRQTLSLYQAVIG